VILCLQVSTELCYAVHVLMLRYQFEHFQTYYICEYFLTTLEQIITVYQVFAMLNKGTVSLYLYQSILLHFSHKDYSKVNFGHIKILDAIFLGQSLLLSTRYYLYDDNSYNSFSYLQLCNTWESYIQGYMDARYTVGGQLKL